MDKEMKAVREILSNISNTRDKILKFKEPKESLPIPEEFYQEICHIILKKYESKLENFEKQYLEYMLSLI